MAGAADVEAEGLVGPEGGQGVRVQGVDMKGHRQAEAHEHT